MAPKTFTYNWAVYRDGDLVSQGVAKTFDEAKQDAEQGYVNAGMGNALARVMTPRRHYSLLPKDGGTGMAWR